MGAYYRQKLPWVDCVVAKYRAAKAPEGRRGRVIYGNAPGTQILEHDTWYAVDLLMNNFSAISRFDKPADTSLSTSISRSGNSITSSACSIAAEKKSSLLNTSLIAARSPPSTSACASSSRPVRWMT